MTRKTLAITAFLCALMVTVAVAGERLILGMDVREDRPRIWMTPERAEALKAKLKGDPIPGTDPGAKALSWLLTGNAEDGDAAVKAMLEFDITDERLEKDTASDEYRWAAVIPLIYDWCHDRVPAEQRSKFAARYAHIAEVMNSKEWGSPKMPGNNYYAGYMRNSGIFGLAALGETPLAESLLKDAFVTRWENSSLPYYNTDAKGGIVGEGSQYDRYNIGYILWLAEAARTAGGRDMMRETNWFREFAYYTIYGTTPARARAKGQADPYFQRFPFGDCEMWQGYPAVDDVTADAMRYIALAYGGEKVGGHAAEYVWRTEPPRGLLGWVVEDGRHTEELEWDDLPLDYFAPGVSYAFARSGWDESATAVMLQLGVPKDGGHRQADAGSFQIVRGGSWMTKESTGYHHQFKGTLAREARAHNTVLFDGRSQAYGYPDGEPRVLALETHPFFFHAVVDLDKALRASASPRKERDDVPGAAKSVREFLYVRPDLLIVFDRLESTSPEVKKTFVVHFAEKPKEESKGQWVLDTGGGQFVAQVVYPADVETTFVDEGDVEGRKAEPGFYQWRMEATQSGEKEQYFMTVLAAQERFDLPPTCTLVEKEDTIGMVISQPGRRTEVHFNKTTGPSFGRLIIDAAGAYGHAESTLPATLDAISVGPDGPAWTKAAKQE